MMNSGEPPPHVEVSDDTSARANATFKKLYTQEISLHEMIDLLKQLKNSQEQLDRDVYACMIQNLLDEYRSFHKYPMKELQITGLLFGLLIQNQLVSSFTLGIALRYVLEALRNSQDGKVFQFGMWALEQFKTRLPQWPQYCKLISQIDHLRTSHPELIAFIDSVLANPKAAAEAAAAAASSGGVSSGNSMASGSAPSSGLSSSGSNKAEAKGLGVNSLNTDTLLQSQTTGVPVPDEGTIDRVHFILNNVSKQNLRAKATELLAAVEEEFFPYFSRYLVVKRVCTENNFHGLYADLLVQSENRELNAEVLAATYQNIKILLSSEKIVTSSAERSLLKNLGSWLGLITLARSKPILSKHLDLKGLIIDAFEQKRFIAVIPFVAKVLEPCGKNKIFRPPNPWLMAIVSLLKEISELPGLKLNLKFEIEVLSTHLAIKMKDIPPSSLLKDRPTKDLNVVHVNLDPRIEFFNHFPHLKPHVMTAIDRAIREIISPVVERSVTIACVTARELILKDFSLEGDEQKMRSAAHQMVQNLASSLALVTCKEPLRISINNNLVALIDQNLSQPDDRVVAMVEQACNQVSQDNLDLGCSLIEKAAADRAVREIDDTLLSEYQSRSKAKASGQPFTNHAFFQGQNRIIHELPDPLRPHGPLRSEQLALYDDFARISHHPTGMPILPPRTATQTPASGSTGGVSGAHDGSKGVLPPGAPQRPPMMNAPPSHLSVSGPPPSGGVGRSEFEGNSLLSQGGSGNSLQQQPQQPQVGVNSLDSNVNIHGLMQRMAHRLTNLHLDVGAEPAGVR